MADFFPLVVGAHLITDQRTGATFLITEGDLEANGGDDSHAYEAVALCYQQNETSYLEPIGENSTPETLWMAYDVARLTVQAYKDAGDVLRMMSAMQSANQCGEILQSKGFSGPSSHPWAWHDDAGVESAVVRIGPYWTLDMSIPQKDALIFEQRTIDYLDRLADEGVEIPDDVTEVAAIIRANGLPHDRDWLRSSYAELMAEQNRNPAAEAAAAEQPAPSAPQAGV